MNRRFCLTLDLKDDPKLIEEYNEHFSFEAKAKANQSSPKVQEWEKLMWKFQRPLADALPWRSRV